MQRRAAFGRPGGIPTPGIPPDWVAWSSPVVVARSVLVGLKRMWLPCGALAIKIDSWLKKQP